MIPEYLSLILTNPILPILALYQLSKLGVALPKIRLALWLSAKTKLISLAWYLGFRSCCLYDGSCSSSTTINPKFLNGKNNAERGPTIMQEASSCSHKSTNLFHISTRSCRLNLLWYTKIFSPKYFCNLLTKYVVRLISGKRYNTCLPASKYSWMRVEYISVFPLPGTPYKSTCLFLLMYSFISL